MAASPAGRLWAVAVFGGMAVLLSPFFHRSFAAGTLELSSSTARLALILPAACAFVLILVSRMLSARDAAGGDRASQAEQFVARFSTRLHLALAGFFVIAAGLALAGLPLKAMLYRGIALATVVLALKALLRFAASPLFMRALAGSCVLVLGFAAVSGAARYSELWSKVAAGNALLAKDKPDDAQKIHDEARAMNKILFAKAPEVSIETEWAKFYERTGGHWHALQRWYQVADMQQIDRATFAPIVRMQCRTGDSVTAWRKLVFEGLPAVSDPEIAPGINAMADTNGIDVRAKLLAALLAWEHNEPEVERRRRLEDVQKVVPGEPSSFTLLKRMGVEQPERDLWLPADLLVGDKATLFSVLGGIGELGETQTLCVLDKGRWEIALRARGVPLNEEWPIIRMEINGQVVGRTQVTRADEHDVPFVCEVNRGNMYRIRIVFENMSTDFQQGRRAMRGVAISGITFRKAKE